MKKKLVIFSLLLIVLAACGPNKFKVIFDLSSKVGGNYSVVYHAADKKGGLTIQGVVPLMQGKYELDGVTILPTLLFLSNATYKIPIVIYAEKGDKIEVTGEAPDPYTWKIGGNDINVRLSGWRNANAAVLLKGDPQSINKAVEQYVGKNPSDPVSTILLLTNFSRKTDDNLYRKLWSSLSGDAKDNKWTKLVGRADQPQPSLGRNPAKIRSMVARKFPAGVDTLRFNKVDASILFFWGGESMRNKQFFDTLKLISREFPDSSERLIADICVEPDSMLWRNALRDDSIKKVSRLWVPAGLADENLLKMKVDAAPFYIVVTSDGEQAYRGNRADSALVSFRRLMKK